MLGEVFMFIKKEQEGLWKSAIYVEMHQSIKKVNRLIDSQRNGYEILNKYNNMSMVQFLWQVFTVLFFYIFCVIESFHNQNEMLGGRMTSLRMKERKFQGSIHPLKQPPLGWGKLLESTFSELWNIRGKKKETTKSNQKSA